MSVTTIQSALSAISTNCYHCGEICEETTTLFEAKSFCCEGCKMVYEILNINDLTQFYKIEKKAGISFKNKKKNPYTYLDDRVIVEKLIDFSNEKISKATFHIPQIHCASCIWLLENLYKLNDGILAAKVNFLKKELYITFAKSATTYREIVELLATIGYAPSINLNDLESPKQEIVDRRFYYQLGIAGFAFGNIMLLSLPEYFGLTEKTFQEVFGYLNILLILPVLFYSSRGYWTSAWQGLRHNCLNIDVPITLGIFTLFTRSLFEILTHTGAGYMDSLAGLVFFLLIGKWFQQVTYYQLSFERDYKSYFPVAVTVLKNGVETSVALSQLNIGDVLVLKSGELIPADGILQKGKARIDYSFVTGESETISKVAGEMLYAGGRQIGGTIRVGVTKKVTQSYLTQLWNEDTFQKNTSATTTSILANRIGQYFTYAILTVAFITLLYWLPKDLPLAINAFTAVLIIACPCAVALSIPFTFGNALRLLGQSGFYVKNIHVLEQLNNLTTVVFDKTGTITETAASKLDYQGSPLTMEEKVAIYTLASQSTHPKSRQIVAYFSKMIKDQQSPRWRNVPPTEPTRDAYSFTQFPIVKNFQEVLGQGINGHVNRLQVKIEKVLAKDIPGTAIWINGQLKGVFVSHNQYRNGFGQLVQQWKNKYKLFLLSGDNDKEQVTLTKWITKANLHFNQSPKGKLQFIQQLQQRKEQVVMFGDGLNDAGALRQADVGIVITENTNNFSPACDAILDARQFDHLPDFIHYAQQSLKVVYAAYGLAFIYNIVGLSYAVQGTLSPVIAAILMPLSSITIVVFGIGMTYLLRPKKLII